MDSFWLIIINCSQCPLMYMIYPCISLSSTKHRNKWEIAKLRFSKSFLDVPALSKSHNLLILWVQWAFYLLFCIATNTYSSKFKSLSLRIPKSFCYLLCHLLCFTIFVSATLTNVICALKIGNDIYLDSASHSSIQTIL